MPLSFVAYNKLHGDTHLAVPDKQVEPSFSQKKKKKSKGEETRKQFKEFQYLPCLKICLSLYVADTGYVCFEEQVKNFQRHLKLLPQSDS